MGTNIRPETSGKNKYWVEKHRYYELKHFCLQYPIWKKAYSSLDSLSKKSPVSEDKVANQAITKLFYVERIKMIECVAELSDPDLKSYIIKGITEGLSYDYLKTKLDIPCCKDTYYDRYRKFFWLLNQERQ